MSKKSGFVIGRFIIIYGMFMWLSYGFLFAVETYETGMVSSSDVDPAIIVEFTSPSGSTGTGRVLVAKFVTDDNSGNSFGFRLDTHDITQYPYKEFRIVHGNVSLKDADNNTVAGLRARDMSLAATPEVAAAGYRIIKVSIKYTDDYDFGVTTGTWKLRVLQPAPDPEDPAPVQIHLWGFWDEGIGESTVESSVTRPYLIEYIENSIGNPDVTNFAQFVNFPTTKNFNFGDVHIDLNDSLVQSEPYQFINVGTKTLDIQSVNPGIFPPNIAFKALNYPGSGSDVLPLAAFTGTEFKCKPEILGDIPNQSVTITTVNSAPYTNLQINLIAGRAIRLNTAILLDLSGSMNDDIHGVRSVDSQGKPTNDENERKIYHAREAGRLLVNMYASLLPSGRMGLFTYPDLDGNCPGSQQVVAIMNIGGTGGNQNALDNRLNNSSLNRIAPEDQYYLTPMAEGIKKVYNVLNPLGINENETTAVVMIGDGNHFCDSEPPKETPLHWETDLSNSEITFYTIPYGDNVASWVQQLRDIAEWTGGFCYPTNLLALTNEGNLLKNHENAIRDALDLEVITEPAGEIGRNQQKSHSICVERDAYTLTFITRWDIKQANAISAKLQTPEGETITPSTAHSSPNDVGYFSSGSYIGYVVKGRYLQGSSGKGQWQLKLTGSSGLHSEQTVSYDYSAYAQSSLKTKHNFDLQYAGDKGILSFAIGDNNHQVRNLTSTIEYKVPSQYFGTYLSTTFVDPKLIYKAPDTINGNPASLADKKYYVLENILKKPYRPEYRTIKQNLENLVPVQGVAKKMAMGSSQTYTSVLKETQIAGFYNLYATIEGITAIGDCYQREIWADKYVEVNLISELLGNQLELERFEITPFFPPDLPFPPYPQKGMIRRNIVFTPKDSFGNYWGPGHANQVSFSLNNPDKEARFIGPVIDNLDGSYIQVVEYKKGIVPQVSVTARGVTSPVVKLKPAPTINMGIKAGFNFANLSASGSTPMFDWNNKTGFCAGAYLSLKLSNYFAFQPEVLFSRKGLKVDQVIDQVTTTSTFNIDFLEIPVLLKYTFSPSSSISPCLFAGPFAAIKLNDNVITGAGVPPISKFDYGITFGGGFDVKLGGNILTLETRYTMGLKNISEDASMTVKSKVLSFIIGLEL